jgi:DNA modification methylase
MGHPAAFPVGLPEFFIKLFTKSGDSVLDPFAGSGSTGMAAEQLERNVVLIDNKEQYFQAMKERLSKKRVDRERFFIIAESGKTVDYYAMPRLLETKNDYVIDKVNRIHS